VAEKTFNVDDYAFVLGVEASTQTGFTSNRAKLLTADGTLLTVNTDDDYATGTNNLLNTIVIYRKDDDGNYVLRKAATVGTNGTLTTTATASVATYGLLSGGSTTWTMKNTSATVQLDSTHSYYANSETVFVVMTSSASGTDFDVYTGIKNAPTITYSSRAIEAAWTLRNSNVLGIVFIDATGATVTNATKDVLFLAGQESVSDKIVDSDNTVYYTYNAVKNGEITKVKVKAVQDASSAIVAGEDSNGAYINAKTNNKDLITYADVVTSSGTYQVATGAEATGIWKLSGTYTIGLTANKYRYTVASDAKMFRIDTDGNITKIDSVSSIYSDANAKVIALLNTTDGDLDYIFIQEVDTNPSNTASGGTYTPVTGAFDTLTDGSDLKVNLTGGTTGDSVYIAVYQVSSATGTRTLIYDNSVTRTSAATQSVTVGTATQNFMYTLYVDGSLIVTSPTVA
jgi:hypothetical protein